jgi:hypothetical protein
MFLTSKVWSLTSKTFVYSFEHLPQRSTASHFLTGLPLIRGSDELKKPGKIVISKSNFFNKFYDVT